MRKSLDGSQILTTGDVGRMLRVSITTIVNWTERGFLRMEYLTPGRHRRYLLRDVLIFAERYPGVLGCAVVL